MKKLYFYYYNMRMYRGSVFLIIIDQSLTFNLTILSHSFDSSPILCVIICLIVKHSELNFLYKMYKKKSHIHRYRSRNTLAFILTLLFER